MKHFIAILLVGLPALHGFHVFMPEVGAFPPNNSGRPLSWSSMDRIAASGLLGKSAILAIDCLLIGAGIKLLLGARGRRAGKQENKRFD
ncbi:hypothetical protein ABID97_002438 [Variovorax sp. OAS795]|uniref:hypothetical protein n=1 Tax=Variovorax sp. OAS795 TaxID=3034231 RepID=UPI00339270C4